MRKFFQDNKILWTGIVSLSLLGLLCLGAWTVSAAEGTVCTVGTQSGVCKGAGCSVFGEVDLKASDSYLATTCGLTATTQKCCATACSGTRVGNTESVNGICQATCAAATDSLTGGDTTSCSTLTLTPTCCALTTKDSDICTSLTDPLVTGVCKSAACTPTTDAIESKDCANCCKVTEVPPGTQFDKCAASAIPVTTPPSTLTSAGGTCQASCDATKNETEVTVKSSECATTEKCCKVNTPADDTTPGTTTNPPSTTPAEAGAFAKVLSWFISLIIQLGGALLLAVVELIVKVSQFNRIINSYFVVQAWIILRDLVNMFFVLGLLFIAFVTVLKIEKYQWQKLLPKLLIMAVVVNFSRTICGLIIDFFQVMMFTFINAYKDIAGENVFKGLGARDMWDQIIGDVPGSKYGDMALIAGRLLGLIYIIIALIVMVIFLVILVFRIVALWVLVVFSPLAFFSYAFSGMSGKIGGYWTKWFNMFMEYCMVGPLLAFFLWISILSMGSDYNTQYAKEMSNVNTDSQGQASLVGSTAPAGVTNNNAGRLDYVMKYVLGIIMLVAGLKFTSEMKVIGASAAGKAASKIQDTAYKTASRVARSPLYAAGLGLAGAGVAGAFGYRQYVQPRVQGTVEGVSKAWQTKTSYGDFGRKILEGTRNRLGTSEAPTLRRLAQALGGTPAELPANIGKARRLPGIGDLAAMGKSIWDETALTKGQREYIKKRTKATADAILSKDYKPLRDVDAKRSDEIMKMLPIDLENMDQVKSFLDNFLKENNGQPLDIPKQRLVEGLYKKEADLGISNEDRYNQMKDAGFMAGASRLERRIFEKDLEEREKKSRGWNNSLSGDIYNPDTKQQEDYSDVRDGIEDAIKASGMDRQKARNALLQIDFDKLAKKGDGTFDTSSLSGDQKTLVDAVNGFGVDSNMFKGVARSTEFQKKKEQEIASNIKAAGKDKFVALNNDRNYGNVFYYGVNNMDPVMSAAAEQRQYTAEVSKPIRDRNLEVDNFNNARDNQSRVEILRKNPEHLAAIIESMEDELIKMKELQPGQKISDIDDSRLEAAMDKMSQLQALDKRNNSRPEKDSAARLDKAVKFASKYDADKRLEEGGQGEASDIMTEQREAARAREGVGVKLKQAIKDNIPGLTDLNVDSVFDGVNEQIDAIIKSAKDQQTRTAAIAKVVSAQLANIGMAFNPDQLTNVASAISDNTDAIKKRIKAMDEGYKEFGGRVQSFQNMLNAVAATGKPPSADDLTTFNIIADSLVDGVKKYAKNNALEGKFDVDTIQDRLKKAITPGSGFDLGEFMTQMNSLQAGLAEARESGNAKALKDARTKINELNNKWKGLFEDIQDVGFKSK